MACSTCHFKRGYRLQLSASRIFQGGRTIARFVAVLILALALAAPAWVADADGDRAVEANASQAEGVDASGDDSSGTEDDGEVSGSGTENCNPNYEGECLDQAGDYDCPDGEGNGPNFTEGEVEVVGEDEYDLDNEDDDNIGCNDQDGEGSSDNGATPSGGVDSGFGPVTPQASGEIQKSSPPLLMVSGVLVALAASGIAYLVARKRAQG